MTRRPADKPKRAVKVPEVPKATAKRGRPRKPAKPPASPAVAAPTTMSVSDCMLAELDAVKAKAALGRPLANHESRLLRDAWLMDQALHLWANLEACAADLQVSPSTVRGYATDGCPGLEPHSPIPKAPVLAWLLRRAHDRGGEQHATKQTIEEAELRIRLAKAAKLEQSLIAEAEDRARQAVLTLMSELRHALLQTLPSEVATAARAAADQDAATAVTLAAIERAMRDRPLPTPPEHQ